MLHANSTMRPPDWRWRRVCELVEIGAYATLKYDGETVCRVVRHVRKLNRLCAEWAVRRLALREPDVFFALKLAQEDTLRPLEIKARVLARQSDRAIAREVGLPVGVVEVFVGLYFDVRERLHAQSWIATQVVGFDLRRPPSAESLFLMAAYHRGPSVVEDWIDFLRHQGEPYDLATEVGRSRAAIQLLIDIHQLADSEATRWTLVKRLDVIASIRTKSTETPTAAAATSRSVVTLTQQITWNDGSEVADEQQDRSTQSQRQGAWRHNRGLAQAG